MPDRDGFPAELAEQLRALFLGAALERAQAGIILCEWIVARLGGPIIDPYQE